MSKRSKSRKAKRSRSPALYIVLLAIGLLLAYSAYLYFQPVEPSRVPSAGPVKVTPAPSTPSETAFQGRGNIIVWSSPSGAKVYVDGTAKGTTGNEWLSIEKAPGTYDVKLILSGYEEYNKKVTVVEGENAKVEVYLTPVSTVTPTPTLTPIPSQTTTPTPSQTTPAPTPIPSPTVTEVQLTPTLTPTTTPVPTQQPAIVSYNIVELTSSAGSGTRINVPRYTTVEVWLTVTASAPTSGSLSVEVKKDLGSWTTDPVFTTLTKQVSLQSGTNRVSMGSFMASDLSGSDNFVQYFFKPSWNSGYINDPTNRDTREAVTTYAAAPTPTPTPTPTATPAPTPVPTGSMQISTVGFSTADNPLPVITVNKNQPVNVYVYVMVSGGTATKSIRLDVRKDIVGWDDQSLTNFEKTITRASSGWEYMGTFYPVQATSTSSWPGTLRQYFARAQFMPGALVYWEYDPTDENTRPRVYVQ